jgi:8-oxo-dGTP pyrophosphatase MutT (NUDIX family)
VTGSADGDAAPSAVDRGGPQVIPRPSLWTPGRLAPWSQVGATTGLILPDRVRAAVPPDRTGRPSPVKELGASPSAVLIPIYEEAGELHVVLTRRAQSLRTHKGEVSFPGGRADPGETYVEAALREAQEEVFLDPSLVEPLGELDHLTTVTRRAYIVPIVGLIHGRPELGRNPAEVEAVLHVPLSELMSAHVFREELWGEGDTARPVYFFELVGDTVWGATAALLRQLLAMLTGTDPGGPTDLDPARGLEMVPFPLGPDGLGGVV